MYYTAKDATYSYAYDDPGNSSIFKMVDVAYYDDVLTDILAKGRPLVMYDLKPTRAGAVEEDNSFSIDIENGHAVVEQSFTGGASYRHPLWSLSTDVCYTTHPYGRQYYAVESRAVSENRAITLFSPTRRIDYLRSPLLFLAQLFSWGTAMDRLLPGKALQRWQPEHGPSTIGFRVRRGKEMFMNIGRRRSPMSVDIPLNKYDYLVARANEGDLTLTKLLTRTTPSPLTIGITATIIGAELKHEAAMVYDHVLHCRSHTGIIDNYSIPVSTYEALGVSEPTLKPSLRPLFNPIIPGNCFCPTASSTGNMRFAIDKRITSVRPNVKMNSYLAKCITDFVSEFVPLHKRATLTPAPYADFVRNMTKPAQRAEVKRLADNFMFQDHDLEDLKNFIKIESYAKPGAPRIITTFPTSDKSRYSLYCYSLSEYLKTTHWYAFGKTPVDTEKAVASLLERCPDGVITTDFTKFDGTISCVLRELERQVIMTLFHPKYVNDCLDQHGRSHNRFVAPKGAKPYDLFNARASGSPETSVMNSLCNAFFNFVAMTNAKMTPRQAYQNLGLYGGDDGISPDIENEHLQRAATSLGLIIKRNDIAFGGVVDFLGRRYGPTTWVGQPQSVIDLPRCLAKIHATKQNINVPDARILSEKAYSIRATDGKTPIVRAFAESIINISRVTEVVFNPLGDFSYTSMYNGYLIPEDLTFTLTDDDWVYTDLETLGYPRSWVDQVEKLMYDVRSFEEMAGIIWPAIDDPGTRLTRHEILVPMIVDDEVMLPANPCTNKTAPSVKTTTSRPDPTAQRPPRKPVDKLVISKEHKLPPATFNSTTHPAPKSTPKNGNQKSIPQATKHRKTPQGGKGKTLAAAHAVNAPPGPTNN
jgi:hypothetical protein